MTVFQKACVDVSGGQGSNEERGPFDGLEGEAPPRLQVYERVGISLVGVYER